MFLFSANLSKSVEDMIIYYAQSCAKERLCQEIGTVKPGKLENINRYNKHKHNEAYTDNSKIDVISLTFLFENHTLRVMI